jgi:hypothetical protein
MGLYYVYGREPQPSKRLLHDKVSADQEIERLGFQATENGMRVLTKTSNVTWGSAGGTRSNLDHVIAADQLKFKSFGGKEVDVGGGQS